MSTLASTATSPQDQQYELRVCGVGRNPNCGGRCRYPHQAARVHHSFGLLKVEGNARDDAQCFGRKVKISLTGKPVHCCGGELDSSHSGTPVNRFGGELDLSPTGIPNDRFAGVVDLIPCRTENVGFGGEVDLGYTVTDEHRFGGRDANGLSNVASCLRVVCSGYWDGSCMHRSVGGGRCDCPGRAPRVLECFTRQKNKGAVRGPDEGAVGGPVNCFAREVGLSQTVTPEDRFSGVVELIPRGTEDDRFCGAVGLSHRVTDHNCFGRVGDGLGKVASYLHVVPECYWNGVRNKWPIGGGRRDGPRQAP